MDRDGDTKKISPWTYLQIVGLILIVRNTKKGQEGYILGTD